MLDRGGARVRCVCVYKTWNSLSVALPEFYFPNHGKHKGFQFLISRDRQHDDFVSKRVNSKLMECLKLLKLQNVENDLKLKIRGNCFLKILNFEKLKINNQSFDFWFFFGTYDKLIKLIRFKIKIIKFHLFSN